MSRRRQRSIRLAAAIGVLCAGALAGCPWPAPPGATWCDEELDCPAGYRCSSWSHYCVSIDGGNSDGGVGDVADSDGASRDGGGGDRTPADVLDDLANADTGPCAGHPCGANEVCNVVSGLPICNCVADNCGGTCLAPGECCTAVDCGQVDWSCDANHQCVCPGVMCNGACVLGGCCGGAYCGPGFWECAGTACSCVGLQCSDGYCAGNTTDACCSDSDCQTTCQDYRCN